MQYVYMHAPIAAGYRYTPCWAAAAASGETRSAEAAYVSMPAAMEMGSAGSTRLMTGSSASVAHSPASTATAQLTSVAWRGETV